MLALPLVAVLSVTPAVADSEWARESYRLNCAPCHGARGEGLDPDSERYATFKSPPADFTAPMFNSMEPSADWFLVTKYGGARIGLSTQMPAYGEAFTDEQIESLVAHLKTLADTTGYPPGELNFLRAVRTVKAFPENELLLIHRYTEPEQGGPSRKNTVYYGRRFSKRQQGEVKLTYVDDDDTSAIDEAELGYKWAVHHNLEQSRLVAAGLEVELPIEDADAPNVYVPTLALGQGLSDATTFQAMARTHLPDDGIDGGDLELSGVLHWMPSQWPRSVSPAIELTGSAPFSSDGEYEATLVPQLYTGLSRLGHVAFALGAELPLTDMDYDYRIHAFLLWDIADGPFWSGW
jgi:mono/diheme cytochrome c family protein